MVVLVLVAVEKVLVDLAKGQSQRRCPRGDLEWHSLKKSDLKKKKGRKQQHLQLGHQAIPHVICVFIFQTFPSPIIHLLQIHCLQALFHWQTVLPEPCWHGVPPLGRLGGPHLWAHHNIEFENKHLGMDPKLTLGSSLPCESNPISSSFNWVQRTQQQHPSSSMVRCVKVWSFSWIFIMVFIFYTILFLWNKTDFLVWIFQVSASSGSSSTNVPNSLVEIPSNQNYSGCYVSKRHEERVFTISTLNWLVLTISIQPLNFFMLVVHMNFVHIPEHIFSFNCSYILSFNFYIDTLINSVSVIWLFSFRFVYKIWNRWHYRSLIQWAILVQMTGIKRSSSFSLETPLASSSNFKPLTFPSPVKVSETISCRRGREFNLDFSNSTIRLVQLWSFELIIFCSYKFCLLLCICREIPSLEPSNSDQNSKKKKKENKNFVGDFLRLAPPIPCSNSKSTSPFQPFHNLVYPDSCQIR